MKHFFSASVRALLAIFLLIAPLAGRAQSLTQAGFTGLLVPQYAGSGTATRLPILYRATVSGLTANTLYRYYTQAGISSDLGTTNSGAGNPLLITPGTTPAATTYLYTSSASLSVAGGYATFTTDATGAYTGWFGYVNTGNARFTAGNVLYMTIVLATDAVPATVEKRLALDQTLTVLALGTGTTATDATGLRGSSAATPKNLVAVYGNEAGTGRPLALTVVEAIAATGAAVASLPAYYTTNAGDWNTLMPNVLTTGVRRVEQRSVVDGTLAGCASDADGVWPSGANTVSPTAGPTAISLTATDAPLNTSACGSAATPTITTFTPTTGGPGTTVTITGTNLTGATIVRVGAFTATRFTVVNATTITFVVPSGTGSVNGLISVTTPGGTATSTATFNLVSAMLAANALSGLAVYPNPATDRLTVELPTPAPATVALRDLAGRLVLAPAPLAADHQLRLPTGLARGMYLLEVQQSGTRAVRRIEQR